MNVTACCQVGAIFDRFESLAQEEKITLLSLFDPGQYKVSTVPKFAIIKFSWRDSEDKTLLGGNFYEKLVFRLREWRMRKSGNSCGSCGLTASSSVLHPSLG